jgi:hypothetical protein
MIYHKLHQAHIFRQIFDLMRIKGPQSQSSTSGAHTHAHAHAHGFWVGMGAILLFMGGHGFCASLHPTPNRSQTSRMQGVR